jgi:TonB family protein
MKTSTRLATLCAALALLLTSLAVYTASASTTRGASAQANNTAKTRRKAAARRRRARRSTAADSNTVYREGTQNPNADNSNDGAGGGGVVVGSPGMGVTDANPPVPRPPVQGGVLNGKAISKPQPPYPAIARAARASGTVVVQILVDESGRVISARAVSGHPLLQQAAVAAARQARFSPTLLSGQPVKVSGVITYNFVLQ